MITETQHTKTEKQLVPRLRFKEFEGEWDRMKIGELTDVFAGGTPSTRVAEYWNGNVLWMNSGELNLKRVYDVENRITELGLKNSSTRIIPKYSILIGLAGQGKTRGTVAMNLVELCTNQSVASIYPNSEIFNSEFIYQNLDGRYEEIRRMSTGDGGRGGLNLKIIKSIKVYLPTLPEQQKIASFLTAVDTKLQQLTQKKELLQQYKKGVMQQLFSQQLRFKKEDGSDYPDWEEKKLGELVDIRSGNSPSSYHFNDDGTIPFLKVEELNNCVKYQKNSRFYTHQELGLVSSESIIFPKRGAAILNNKVRINVIPVTMDSNLMAITPRDEILTEFLYYKIVFVELFRIADTSTIPQINNKHINPFKIDLPSKEEQQHIASYLSALDTKIETVTQQIETTQGFKKGLLQQLFV